MKSLEVPHSQASSTANRVGHMLSNLQPENGYVEVELDSSRIASSHSNLAFDIEQVIVKLKFMSGACVEVPYYGKEFSDLTVSKLI